MENKFISVLVPAYNQENYIQECVESLLNQTYDNFEIVILNDGSTDHTGEILEKYRDNPKVRLLYKENERSIAKARNFLMNEIRGEYFIFVDSDDSVSPSYLSLLVEAMEKRNSDIACCAFSFTHVYGRSTELLHYETNARKYALDEMILGSRGGYVLWNKLIKSELVKNLRFEEMSFGEDFIFVFELMQQDVNVAFISNKLYFYRYFVNRRKKNVIDVSKRRFLNYMIEMEKNPNRYLEDKKLLSTWIVATSMYYLTMAHGIYRHILMWNIRVRKRRVGSLMKSLSAKAIKSIFGL